MNKKPKSLVRSFTWPEACNYVENHPDIMLPDIDTAQSWDIEDVEHTSFWISDTLGGYRVVYSKSLQMFHVSHPQIKHHVVLKRI